MEALRRLPGAWLDLYVTLALYLLVGLLLAGLLHVLFRPAQVARRLGGGSWRSILNATLIGIPLPLCSCGVIPMALGLRRQGAGRGPTLAFLSATPQTGVDSFLPTWALLGAPFALLRVLCTLVSSAATGRIVSALEPEEGAAGAAFLPDRPLPAGLGARLREALRYAIFEHLGGIYHWLLLGLTLAALVSAFFPLEEGGANAWIERLPGGRLGSWLAIAAIGLPMYVCATGSIPFAVVIAAHLGMGAAFVFLALGPATNVATMILVWREMGRRTFAVYLAGLTLFTLLGAAVVDAAVPYDPARFERAVAHCHGEGVSSKALQTGAWALGGALALVALRDLATALRPDRAGAPGQTEMGVGGMTCESCRTRVTQAVSSIPGTHGIEVDLAAGKVRFRFDGAEPPLDAIREAIARAGYAPGGMRG